MTYDKRILSGVEIVNNVFRELGISPLLNNSDFKEDEASHEKYLKVNLKKDGCINLSFVFSLDGVQINIDRIEEGVEWSYQQYEKSAEQINSLIKLIFTSGWQVQYCGSNYTKIFLLNKKDECVKTIKSIGGLYLKINCQNKKYPPIFNS